MTQIQSSYDLAKERYAAYRVDTEAGEGRLDDQCAKYAAGFADGFARAVQNAQIFLTCPGDQFFTSTPQNDNRPFRRFSSI
jgi:hypothetical protein